MQNYIFLINFKKRPCIHKREIIVNIRVICDSTMKMTSFSWSHIVSLLLYHFQYYWYLKCSSYQMKLRPKSHSMALDDLINADP